MSEGDTPTHLPPGFVNSEAWFRGERSVDGEGVTSMIRCSCDCACIQRIYPESGVMCARCLDGDCPCDVELGEEGYPESERGQVDTEWLTSLDSTLAMGAS